jgi:hypothetical protein
MIFFTRSLFNYLLNGYIFTLPCFCVHHWQSASAEPSGDGNVSDLAIIYVDTKYHWHTICFIEADVAEDTSDPKITAIEKQALGYCNEFLNTHPDRDRISTCTLVVRQSGSGNSAEEILLCEACGMRRRSTGLSVIEILERMSINHCLNRRSAS